MFKKKHSLWTCILNLRCKISRRVQTHEIEEPPRKWWKIMERRLFRYFIIYERSNDATVGPLEKR